MHRFLGLKLNQKIVLLRTTSQSNLPTAPTVYPTKESQWTSFSPDSNRQILPVCTKRITPRNSQQIIWLYNIYGLKTEIVT